MEDVKEMNESLKQKDEIYGAFHIGLMEVVINVKSIHEVVNFPDKIIQMPLAPHFLLGVFNLRGLIIPIINLKALLKFDDSSVSLLQKVAIVDHEGAKVGLLFDSTSEILRINPQEINDFVYQNENSHRVVSGAIKLDSGNRILQVINPFALVTIENIPQIIDQQKKYDQRRLSTLSMHEKRSKCISFSVHDLKLGFEISGIHEIIKVTELQSTPINSDLCLGMVNLRGASVPVIDFAVLLGMDTKSSTKIEDRRIIVLKVEKNIFGLMVDAVESINPYLHTEIMPIPLLNKARAGMFTGCIPLDGYGDVILLNYEAVLSHEDILGLTQGYSKIYGSSDLDSEKSKKSINRQAYISFKLDHLFGVSIKDIREIINYTDEIMQAPGMPTFIKGVLNLRGKLVTIVDTRLLYGMGLETNIEGKTKILIFESGDEKIGLIVDSVESIINVDEDKKMKVPSLMTQKVQEQMQNDIKEIISFPLGEKEGMLIVLNMEPVSLRIKNAIAA